jgi:hypothetical protein
VKVSVPVPPAAKGVPPSAAFKLSSTEPPTTSVLIDAELFVVLSSLSFDTAAEAETVLDSGVTAPLTLMAGSDPPAGTGPGLVQVAEGRSQLHPVPEADVVENGSGMLTVTKPELAAVPLLYTVTMSVPVPPATKDAPPSAMFTVRSTGPATTSVLNEAELLLVLPSLPFDTDADAETTEFG